MSAQAIAAAREQYLAKNPFDPKANALMGYGADGMPSGFLTMPNLGDVQILGCKLGMEYLAICHDEDLVEEWIHTCMGLVKDPELLGLLLVNVFRGVNLFLGDMIGRHGLREAMEHIAAEAWERDFSGGETR